jgi:hypothetical protein
MKINFNFIQKAKSSLLSKSSNNTLKSRIDKIKNSEAFKIGSAVFLSIGLFVFVAPILLNNSDLKFQIVQKLSKTTQSNISIYGKLSVSLLPYPTIVANDVVLQGYRFKTKVNNKIQSSKESYNVYSKKVKIKFPLFKLSGRVLVKEVIIDGAIFEKIDYEISKTINNNDIKKIEEELVKKYDNSNNKRTPGVSTKFFSITDIESTVLGITKLPKIKINDGKFISYYDAIHKNEINDINFDLSADEEEIIAKGSFISSKIKSELALFAKFKSESKKYDSYLKLSSPILNLKIKGNYRSENLGLFDSEFVGIVDAEILELKSFYKSYVSASGYIANKLKFNDKSIKINSKINSNNGEIFLEEIKIDSSNVKGTGSAEIFLSSKIPASDIRLDLQNLDLDSIWSPEPYSFEESNVANKEINDKDQNDLVVNDSKDKENKAPESKIVTNSNKDNKTTDKPISADKDLDITLDINAKSINYKDDLIKDASFYATISNYGEIMILPSTFRIPGEADVIISGIIYNTTTLPKFIGKLSCKGFLFGDTLKWIKVDSQNLRFDKLKNYQLNSDLLSEPNLIALNNFYLNLNNDNTEINGDIKISSVKNISNLGGSFKITDFNIDDYFLTSERNIYLSSGSLLKKLLWLNNIHSNADLNFKFEKLSYNGENFFDQEMNLKFGRGYIYVSDLSLRSEENDLNINLSVDISGSTPSLFIDIKGERFYYKINKTSNASSESINKIEEILTQQSQKNNKNFFDKFYSIPSLDGFDGKISLKLENLQIDDNNIYRLSLGGNIKNGVLEKLAINGNMYDGTISFLGAIDFKYSKLISGLFTFKNVALNPLMRDLVDIKNISGTANISASIVGSGSSKEEFVKKMQADVNTKISLLTIEGMAINDLVKKLFNPSLFREELQYPESILINQNSKTVFNKADGIIKINKDNKGQVRFNMSAPAINSVLTGKIFTDKKLFDGLLNTVFITGYRNKTIPINIATGISGNQDNLKISFNIDQVRQYLGLPKQASPIIQTGKNKQDQENRNSEIIENKIAVEEVKNN